MSRRNNSALTLTALARILSRRQRVGKYLLGSLLPISVIAACLWPLTYEAQLVVEKRVTKVSPELQNQEFDMTRLTSDTQRNIAFLKSRFMLERWLKAIGQENGDPMAREQALKQLQGSLTVQPINFTDLLILKVRAKSPERASASVTALGHIYEEWDMEQARQQASEMIQLLNSRMTQVKNELIALRRQMRDSKSSGFLSLSGSDSVASMETELTAKERLYNSLTAELDQAQREMQPDTLRRVHLINAPTVSQKPVRSRILLISLALGMSLLLVLVTVLTLEAQDPALYRAGDLYSICPDASVVVIPDVENPSDPGPVTQALTPILEGVRKLIETQGHAVIQVGGFFDGEGKTLISRSLAAACRRLNIPTCLLHLESNGTQRVTSSNGHESEYTLLADEAASDRVAQLKTQYKVVVVDANASASQLPCASGLTSADLQCVVILAGKTSRQSVALVGRQFGRAANSAVFFVLNRWKDPLPTWFQN